MLSQPAKLLSSALNNPERLENLKLLLNNKSISNSENKENSGGDSNSIKQNQVMEEDSSNKKSSFGKNKNGGDKIVIDFNKKEVDLQNADDQKALIQILKKEVRNKKEINFIDRAVNQLKFFSEKKTQLNEKLYSKLLDKLKYQYLEKERALFFHGDKGDKYYIVLKGTLVLLLPPKPFEETEVIDQAFQARLKEKYFRMRDHPQEPIHYRHSHVISNFDDNQRASSPILSSARSKAQTIQNRYINTALKFQLNNNNKPQTPTIQSPQNDPKNGSTPQSRKQSQRFKQQDFDAEKEYNFENTFELYCQAYYPNFKQAFTFNTGAGFGEIALIRKTERSGTVVAKEDCHLMTLDKDSFDEILGRWEREKTDEQLNFLKGFAFFKDINDKYLLGTLHSMKQVSMIRNEVIYNEDETPDNVYFIKDGEVQLSKICHIQKTETLQQQLDKEEIDTLIRGNNNNNNQVQKNKNDLNGVKESNKRNKSETKIPTEMTKKERRNNDNGTRIKFSVISQPCYFGDEEILLELPIRNHMATILSTSAELWIIDKKNFIQLLKQQRTFKIFQDQCTTQIGLRDKRLQKISSTIKKEENKFFINSYKPKHQAGVMMQTLHHEQSLLRLLKDEDELNHTQDENHPHQNNIYQAHNSQNLTKEGHPIITNDQSYINDEKITEQSNSSKLLHLFSRNYYLEQLAQVSSKKMKILKEISQRGIGFNNSHMGHDNQSSLTEYEDQNAQSKHSSIPYQKNLLFQLNAGNGIRKGVYRDPFQTYDDQVPHHSKMLKTTSSASNLLMADDKKRNTLHNLYTNPKSISIKPILEKFEREQLKSHQNSARYGQGENLNKLSDSKQRFFEDISSNRHKIKNSLCTIQPSQIQSQVSSITHINEFGDEPTTKIRLAPISNSLTQLQNTPLTPNNHFDSMTMLEKGKNKYPNLQEIIQDSKQQLHTIRELDSSLPVSNTKRKLNKMKSDTLFENNESSLNNPKEAKPKNNQNFTNFVSIQLLHETEEEEDQSQPQSKSFKFSSNSLVGTTKHTLKSLGDRHQKQQQIMGEISKTEESPMHSNYYQIGKKSRNSLQEIISHRQNQNKIFSTLNLNASENAFDSMRILMTDEGEREQEEKDNNNAALITPTNAIPTSPSHLLKYGSSFCPKLFISNIHMDKLRKQNQSKRLGSTHFVNNYNKTKYSGSSSSKNLFFQDQANLTSDNKFVEMSDVSKAVVNKAFKARSIQINSFRKTNLIKK